MAAIEKCDHCGTMKMDGEKHDCGMHTMCPDCGTMICKNEKHGHVGMDEETLSKNKAMMEGATEE